MRIFVRFLLSFSSRLGVGVLLGQNLKLHLYFSLKKSQVLLSKKQVTKSEQFALDLVVFISHTHTYTHTHTHMSHILNL